MVPAPMLLFDPIFRVAQVREVHRFGAFADGAFLEFDKNCRCARAGLQMIVRAKPAQKGPMITAVIEATFGDPRNAARR